MIHRIVLVVPSRANAEVKIEKSVFCPPGKYYVMGDSRMPMLAHLKEIYECEKEKNDWIRSYENVLQGLNYWKSRALHGNGD